MKTALGLLAVVTILAAPSLSATQSGSPAVTPARVARLEALLRSRYMPVEIRDRLSGWLQTSREVASIGL